MCDPITLSLLVGGATSLGGALLAPKAPAPPELPATAAAEARKPGATVRVGDGQDDETTEATTAERLSPTVERRVSGKALGGLGKGSTALTL
jgi:hypothetical protein